MKLRLLFAALAVTVLCLTGGLFAAPARAQLNTGLNEIGNTVKLSATDPRIIAANIINVTLGLLGIILLGLILYAGFLWMTSGGDPTKIQKAQAIIRNAIIGLIIILMSWAIAYYVINVLLNATQGGGGGTGGGGGPPGCQGLGCGTSGGDVFKVVSATPQGDETNPINTNSFVDITFTHEIDPDITKDWNAYLKVANKVGDPIGGTWEIYNNNPKWIHFKPDTICPEDPNQACFPKSTMVYVTIDPTKFKDANKQGIVCNVFSPCSFKFFVGEVFDNTPPHVTILDLYDYQHFCEDKTYIPISAKATDDFGVSVMRWLEDDVEWATDGPNVSPTPKEFSSSQDWDTDKKILKQPYAIKVTAKDLDSNVGSSTIHLIVLNNHCCNGKKDSDEEDVDCGGKDCLGCNGSSCNSPGQCSSGVCLNGVCAEQPVITNVSPTSGKDGTYVSIWGANFGDTGSTTFMGPPAVEAFAPQACVALGVKTWRSDYILVEVPPGAKTGPIKVYNANSQLSDTTNEDPGPALPDFEVNDVTRPGICGISPGSGEAGTKAILSGTGFGATQGDRVVGFGVKTLIAQANPWNDGTIGFSVPDLYAGYYWVGIKNQAGQILSNGVPFNLQVAAPEIAPAISAITPDHGPTGQYLTIVGTHFGNEQGLVKFLDKATNSEVNGDTVFPPECGSGWWTDTQIIVKMPTVSATALLPGSPYNFKAYIVRNKDHASSNKVDFLYSNEPLGPGICRISPTAGPKQTMVNVWGERFGTSQGSSDQVLFTSQQSGTTPATVYNNWMPTEIDVSVPDAASTGPMLVRLPGQPDSNPAQFLVGDCRDITNLCKAQQICCPGGSCADDKCPAASYQAMYGWQMTTGIIPRYPSVVHACNLNPQPGDLIAPTPSPSDEWPGGKNVCVSQAKIGVMFDRTVDPTTAVASNFTLVRCKGTGIDPCKNPEDREVVAITNFHKQDTIHLDPNACNSPPEIPNCRDYVTFEPAADLQPGSVYAVYIGDQVKSPGTYGTNMPENTSCDQPGSGDCFRFQTRNDGDACQVGFVYIVPYSTAVEGEGKATFEAMPVAKDAVCNLLSCRGFDWDWRLRLNNLPTILADFFPAIVYETDGKVSCRQTVKAGSQEAVSPPVNVLAKEIISTKEGLANLYIKFLIPQVIDHSPDCTTACLNAYLWARFNVSLKPATVTNNYQNIQVFQCKNENCLESDFVGPNLAQNNGFKVSVWPEGTNPEANLLGGFFGTSTVKTDSFITIDPRSYVSDPNNPPLALQPDTYYFVRLRGGGAGAITSQDGVLLPHDFTWKFRTAVGDKALCHPDHIAVFPAKAIEKKIKARDLFQAQVYSAPDACRSDGQWLLVTDNFSWGFTDQNQQVAKFAPFPPSINKNIDADGALPKGCSSDCLAMGSDGVYGQTASCGDHVVETTDIVYCNPQTKLTKAGQPCQILPFSSGAGEQCEADAPGGAACDTQTCLWKNTPPINTGTCGNFVTDWAKGEMCDPGLRCFDTTTSTVASGTPCDSPSQTGNITKAACEATGGKCEIRDYLGCSSGCKNLGASATPGSVCGNGDVGYGEDCDLGSNNGSGGCSNDCLHVGSTKTVGTLCGNGILEPGETCEAPAKGEPVPSHCDQNKCIKLGDPKFCTAANEHACCGDGIVDGALGEECDDGNHISGDGCSAVCLLEGSSWRYPDPGAGFCGDGKVQRGEACEAGAGTNVLAPLFEQQNISPSNGTHKGNGLVDPKQVGEIIGQGTPDADNVIKTELFTTYQNITGKSVFGVQCGYKTDNDCAPLGTQASKDTGIDQQGCCEDRPKKVENYPSNNATDVCRNTLISVTFDKPMDVPSVLGNFILAKEVDAATCPDGTTQLTEVQSEAKGLWPWLTSQWHGLVAWLKGEPAVAQIWCGGLVAGHLTGSADNKTFDYTLEDALDANTIYIARFNGDKDLTDNADLAKRIGIKSDNGVVVLQDTGDYNDLQNGTQQWNYTWSFKTGSDICTITAINVQDLDPDHPAYFDKANQTHPFRATALSLHNGQAEKLSPVSQYNWHWASWLSNAPPIADISGDVDMSGSVSQTHVAAKEKNGSAIIYAAIEITSDTISGSEQLTSPRVIYGALPIMVFICDNPWPALLKAPFRDMKPDKDASRTLQNTIFQSGPFFNFQMMYCRDGAEGLLPELETHPIPLAPIDQMQSILRQYLFTFKEPAYKHDGIGIRIMSNVYHDTLSEWYRRQGFVGQPTGFQVDGYDALRDQGTVYIGFPNTVDTHSNIYENILVISRNLDASDQTTNVFNQLVDSLAFNINFENDNSNYCLGSDNLPALYKYDTNVQNGIQLTKDKPVTCVSDWDCVRTDTSQHCASFKLKLQRDMLRLQDFKTLTTALKSYYQAKGFYPQLDAGTFLSGRTNSRWPSWQETLGKELGLGTGIPVDPVNRFITCGYCKNTKANQTTFIPCTLQTDCPSADYACEAKDNFDPQTCWSVAKTQFMCPAQATPSDFYVYRSFNAGSRIELGANFEIPPPQSDTLKNWWYPEYSSTTKICYTTSTISDGRLCGSDDDCKPCTNPLDTVNCPIAHGPAGSCHLLGTILYSGICGGGNTYGEGGTCGDGVIGKICHGGQKDGQGCLGTGPDECPGGSCQDEVCELGQIKQASCTVQPGNKVGTKLQVCQDCKGWVDDPKVTSCHENALCGNGRIDKVCSGGALNGLSCSTAAECQDGNASHDCILATPAEVCDDGILNGTYGHCNSTCTGIDKFCGNNQLDPGEKCDRGTGAGGNGAWCEKMWDCYTYANVPGHINYKDTCSLDCQGKAPYCGDGQVYVDNEQCDGNILTTAGALCAAGDQSKLNQPCINNGDCGTGGVCGADPNVDQKHSSCQTVKVGRCATNVKICVAASKISDFNSKAWFAQTTPSYTKCSTDSDCTGGECLPLANAGGDEGGCMNENQCSVGTIQGQCIQYDTAHIRKCNPPGHEDNGVSDQCQYEPTWSACKPMHSCGDGVVDPGEECDDGANNANYNACLPTCKKNTCGDGHLWLGAEECDKGTDNGKQVCKADYQSTCNDCSLQCRNLTASGGYCGNNVVEDGEQCDGNKDLASQALPAGNYVDPSSLKDPNATFVTYLSGQCSKPPCKVAKDIQITCQQLGFDYAINGNAKYGLKIIDYSKIQSQAFQPDKAKDILGQGIHITYDLTDYGGINYIGSATLIVKLFVQCGLMDLVQSGNIYVNQMLPQSAWPSVDTYLSCAKSFAAANPGTFEVVSYANNAPYCSLNCGMTGCGRCIDEGGTGVVKGTVYVGETYGNPKEPAKNARVTLQYNGLNVSQAFTADDGTFQFSGLNERSECVNYNLIIEGLSVTNDGYGCVKDKMWQSGSASVTMLNNYSEFQLSCPY